MSGLSDTELDDIEQRTDAATPGPWFVRLLNDVHAMNLVAISTQPDPGYEERWPDFDHSTIVAATLIQEPHYAAIKDDLWEQNAAFIAHARSDIPRLIAEIRMLRTQTKGGDPIS